MESKKLLILQILEILKVNSCKDKPITQTEIGKILEDGGTPCDRKTISRNIDYLVKFGYNIVKISGGGCYYQEKNFSDGELAFLVSNIYSSPSITQEQAQRLIEKLTTKIGYSVVNQSKNFSKLAGITRTSNSEFFYNLELINQAIEHNHKIRFMYNQYDIDKKDIHKSSEEYIVNPYFIVVRHGKYYLVCKNDHYFDISNFRIDLMTSANIVFENMRPLSQTEDNCDDVEVDKYVNEHIYMCDGQTVKAKLKFSSEKIINDIVDWFGKNVKFSIDGDSIYAYVVANEKALVYWSLQYGKEVEIVEPYKTRDLIKTYLRKIAKKYQDEE